MATTITPSFGTEDTSLTINADAIANAAARQSASLTLTALGGQTGVPDDVFLCGIFNTATGTLGSTPIVNVWVGVPATGSRWSDNLGTSDAAFTMLANPGMKLVAVVAIDTANTSKDMGVVSLVSAFGFLPSKIIIVIENKTGLALAGSGGAHASNNITLRPVQFTAQ